LAPTSRPARLLARRTYVRTLHINPVRMYLSYLSGDASGLDRERRQQLERRLGRLARLPASSVANVEHAQVTLNMLLIEHGFARRTDFVQSVVGHYRAQAVDQLYSLLFSADILGQPLSLVQSLGTGVHDFFHEPAKGIVKSPVAFGRGLERGVESLIKNSVYGFANSFHKATGAIGTGVALLSLDSRYQRERQANRVREPAKDVSDGLLLAAKDFGKGVFDGITGIFY
jgi:vacuolar protein sorting-associated protein 13A/C